MKLGYSVHIEPLADVDGGGYLAIVPDLPGCFSDGATPEEALKNVQEAIVSWIEVAKSWNIEDQEPEQFSKLKRLVAEGIEDVNEGRVSEWNPGDFLHRAQEVHRRKTESE